jgi:MFS transporter, DHA1 family, tetracycline resistance protein
VAAACAAAAVPRCLHRHFFLRPDVSTDRRAVHTGWIAQVYSPVWRDAFLSLAFSLFPVGMFFGASLLGDLSDALGRRRTLMICMAGLAVGYALMWASLELRMVWLFLAGRLASCLMAGTAPIAQAAMMDTAPRWHR